MKKLKGLLLLFLFCGSCQAAFGFGLDGSLAEWGVTPGAWGPGSDWVPLPGIHYAVEDYQPGTADGFVDPGFGGQTFDVEAMYATRDSENLYFAVVTGFLLSGFRVGRRPRSPSTSAQTAPMSTASTSLPRRHPTLAISTSPKVGRKGLIIIGDTALWAILPIRSTWSIRRLP